MRDRSLFFTTQPHLERIYVLLKPEYTQPDYAALLETIEIHDFVVVGKMAVVSSYNIYILV
jgi:hypothetical protein